MVKGVNKTVIEVNNTGSKMFEKIVLYVTPEYGKLSAKQLRRAAGSLVLGFDSLNTTNRKPLRNRIFKKRLFLFLSVSLVAIGGIIVLFLLL